MRKEVSAGTLVGCGLEREILYCFDGKLNFSQRARERRVKILLFLLLLTYASLREIFSSNYAKSQRLLKDISPPRRGELSE